LTLSAATAKIVKNILQFDGEERQVRLKVESLID